MSRHLRVTGVPSQVIPIGDPDEDERYRLFAPVLRPDGVMAFYLIAADGFAYWLDAYSAPDDEGNVVEDYPDLVFSLSELHDARNEMVLGDLVSRRRLAMSDVLDATGEALGPGPHTVDEVAEAFEPKRNEMVLAMVEQMAAIVGSGPHVDAEGRSRTIIPFGKAKPGETVGDALDRVWPDDEWTGTVEDVLALLAKAGRDDSRDAVKRALQRGRYVSEGDPGKASVWRRVVGRR